MSVILFYSIKFFHINFYVCSIQCITCHLIPPIKSTSPNRYWKFVVLELKKVDNIHAMPVTVLERFQMPAHSLSWKAEVSYYNNIIITIIIAMMLSLCMFKVKNL